MPRTTTRRRPRAAYPQHILETSAPVAYRAEACRLSDATGLPMTVFATTDPDMPFVVLEFSRGGCFAAPPPVDNRYAWLPLVSFLPTNYFVGNAGKAGR